MIWETIQEYAKCRDALLPAIEMTNGTHNEDDIIAGILTGQFKLFVNGSSGVVTDIVVFPRLKALNIFLIGGKLDEVMPLRSQLEKYREAQGCKRITGLAVRKGWERFLDGEVLGTAMYRDY